ncbi:MAG: DNA-processing protein DprA, partial [Clostridia bacterium]|nr:DNA-processing protein DprA [Clostridia bacterium]
MDETVCRVWLSLALRPGSANAKLFDRFDSAADVWHASADELKEAGAKDGLVSRLTDKDLSQAARIAEFADRYRVSLITLKDPAYPDLLRGIPDPPFLLYVLGRLPDFEKTLSVGVVGTRDMTEYGFETAYRVGYRLASAGVAVVSGMARG